MNLVRLLVLLCVTTLVLAACTAPGGAVGTDPSLSADETGHVADGMSADMEELQTGLGSSATFQALAHVASLSGGAYVLQQGSTAPGSLALARAIGTLAADSELERGVYEYNDSTYGWEKVAASSEYVARWSFTDGDGASRNAVLTVDWDVSQATVVANNDVGGTVELPRDARATSRWTVPKSRASTWAPLGAPRPAEPSTSRTA